MTTTTGSPPPGPWKAARGTFTGNPFTFIADCPDHGLEALRNAYENRSEPGECPEWHTPEPVVEAPRGWFYKLFRRTP